MTLGLYDHDLPPMSEELDLRMRRAAEELWSIGSELLKSQPPAPRQMVAMWAVRHVMNCRRLSTSFVT